MISILVTGSNGQLGNEIKLLASSLPDANFLFHDIDTLDITNFEELSSFFQKQNISFIINCAAYTAVDKAESEIEKAYLINSTAVENLAKIADSNKCKIIHISTDYVFDGTGCKPYIETDVTNPVSVYGKSKLDGEKHLAQRSDAIIIRASWLYSTFGNNFVKTILRIAEERKEIKVVYDQIGSPTYAGDLAVAIINILKLSLKSDDNFKPGMYHFADEGVCSWYDFACEIVQYFKLSCSVIPIETTEFPTPARRPAYSVFNKNKIKKTFSVSIPWWKDSLKICLNKLR